MTTPAVQAALEATDTAPVVCIAVEVVAPTFTLRLVDGAVEGLTFPDGRVFNGSDATYGTLGALQGVTEGIGTEAPRLRLTIRPPTLAAAATLNLPTNQGAPVAVYVVIADPATGAVLPDPELVFMGELDVPRYMWGKNTRAVEYDVASAWEFLFREGEGHRWNDAFHQSIFPGERGLEYVSDVERQLPWGADAPRAAVITSTGGGGGGGGVLTGGGGGLIGGLVRRLL